MIGVMIIASTTILTERDIAKMHRKAMDSFRDEAYRTGYVGADSTTNQVTNNTLAASPSIVDMTGAFGSTYFAWLSGGIDTGIAGRSNCTNCMRFTAFEPAIAQLSLEEKVESIAKDYEIGGRALDVLELLVQGRTAARIAQELFVSQGTVNTYCYRIYQKLGVHSRQELIDKVQAVSNESL